MLALSCCASRAVLRHGLRLAARDDNALRPTTERVAGTLKIVDVATWVVNVPLTTTFTSSLGRKQGTTRTVVRLRTDDGAEGWGETMNGRPVATLIDKLAPMVVGQSPFEMEALRKKFKWIPFYYGYLGYAAIAGIDVACWDLIGKMTSQPLSNLIGGYVREQVPITGLVTRGMAEGVTEASMPRALADRAESLTSEGFTAVKVKGSSNVGEDLRIMEALRERLPEAKLRVDPNGAWSLPDAIQATARIEALTLEYLEDPCWGLEAMSALREKVRVPFCTNMCIVRFEDIAPAVRLKTVDVVHGDVFKWGGIGPTKHLASHCETLGFGMNLHSGGELGLSTAAHLAVVASSPIITYAMDSMYYLAADDILTERLPFDSGALAVPTGYGLGVEVDEQKLQHYSELNDFEGDYSL